MNDQGRKGNHRLPLRSCRLWSLWEMLYEFDNGELIKLVNGLHQNMEVYGGRFFDQVSDEDRAFLENAAESQSDSFNPLGFPMTSLQFNRLSELVATDSCTYEQVVSRLRVILETIEDEAKTKAFFYMDHENQTWFKKEVYEHFGDDVYLHLDDALFDMEESLKCFAFERYTACVGHVTKVTESALRLVADTVLGKANAKKRDFSYKAWASLHDEMNKKLKSVKTFRSKAHKEKVDAQLLALDRLDTIRRTRNEAHHPESRYDRDDAHEMLNHLAGFVKQVIKVI